MDPFALDHQSMPPMHFGMGIRISDSVPSPFSENFSCGLKKLLTNTLEVLDWPPTELVAIYFLTTFSLISHRNWGW